MRRAARVVLAAGALALACGLAPLVASAHAVLLTSEPLDGSLLAAAPASVRLLFSEPVQALADSITVVDPAGARVDRGPVEASGSSLAVPVAASAEGTYVVTWRAISNDTHPASGTLRFSVGRPSVREPSASDAVGPWLGVGVQVAGRLLHELGYGLSFGSIAFGLLVLRPMGLASLGTERLGRLADAGILLLLAAEPASLLGQTASLAPGSFDDPSLLAAALSSSFGRVLAQRAAAALLLWVLVGAMRAGATRAAWGALVLGLALALVDGEASHAIDTGPVWLDVAANTLHVAAAGLWVGGLMSLLAVWTCSATEVHRSGMVERFGALALPTVAVLGASGAGMALLHVTGPGALVATAYGRALVAKTLVVGLALLLAYTGRRVKVRTADRWWSAETVALVGVLTLAGLVVSLPPPA